MLWREELFVGKLTGHGHAWMGFWHANSKTWPQNGMAIRSGGESQQRPSRIVENEKEKKEKRGELRGIHTQPRGGAGIRNRRNKFKPNELF